MSLEGVVKESGNDQAMAILLSHTQFTTDVGIVKEETNEGTEMKRDKYSLGTVAKFFKNIWKTNNSFSPSLSVEKFTKEEFKSNVNGFHYCPSRRDKKCIYVSENNVTTYNVEEDKPTIGEEDDNVKHVDLDDQILSNNSYLSEEISFSNLKLRFVCDSSINTPDSTNETKSSIEMKFSKLKLTFQEDLLVKENNMIEDISKRDSSINIEEYEDSEEVIATDESEDDVYLSPISSESEDMRVSQNVCFESHPLILDHNYENMVDE